METFASCLSVLSAPVALSDRRALSQAWFSALHLNRNHPPASGTARTSASANANDTRGAQPRTVAPKNEPAASSAAPSSKMAGNSVRPQYGISSERRAKKNHLAKQIERTFCSRADARKHATFTLEGRTGRVQILLRGSGAQQALVAICPRSAQERVAAALQQARYALAVHGITLQAEVRGAER